MILPDVNVLVYAFRPGAQFHEICRTWLEDSLSAGETIAVSSVTLAAVVRISTNRRAYDPPSLAHEAIEFCSDLIHDPQVRLIEPGPAHWTIFSKLLLDTNTRGSMVTGAWYAALAMEWNCELVTMDRDFARFPGLRWSMPGQG